MLKTKNPAKLNVLKRIIGRKMVVIKNYIKNEYYYGQVESIVNDSNVIVKRLSGESEEVSIFDLRSPSPEYP
jgi:hypothetical protein